MTTPDDGCQCKGCIALGGEPCFPRPCPMPMTEEDLLCDGCRKGKCCHVMMQVEAGLRGLPERRSVAELNEQAQRYAPPAKPYQQNTKELVQDVLDGLRRLT